MKSLVKTKTLMVRLRPQEAKLLERAARLESRRRGEIIGESTLLRELAMPGVRQIAGQASEAVPA